MKWKSLAACRASLRTKVKVWRKQLDKVTKKKVC